LQYLTILSDTGEYLTIPDHTLTILTNTNNTYQFQPLLTYSKQYLINFVSVGIAWYQHYIEFCHKYTTPVLSWYQHGSDGFLSVWHSHCKNSGNFQKTFNAYSLLPLIEKLSPHLELIKVDQKSLDKVLADNLSDYFFGTYSFTIRNN